MSTGTNEIYEFGPFRADALRRLLMRNGEPVPLTSKAFETLLVLVRNSGRVLEKDELLKTIWPNSFVEEANLAQNVSAVRRALAEAPGEHRYIVTVPGRGYRFVGDVKLLPAPQTEVTVERHTSAELLIEEEEETEPASARPRAKRTAMVTSSLALVLLAALAGWIVWKKSIATPLGARSIAVLPFQLLNAQGEGSLGLGFADAVITKLTNVRRLIVRPTNSIVRYAGTPAEPQAAGRELDVDAVLEGRVQKAGDRLRVTVQLVRIADLRPLWAQTFDGSFADVFAMEDTISEGVAQALAIRIAGGEKRRVNRQYTGNLEAYRNYLDGRYAEFQFTPDGLKRATAYLEKAIAMDPEYALAYAGLADAYTTASDWVLPPREALPKAEAAARHALTLDDGLAEASSALAHAEMHEWKLAEAGKEFSRALALNPNLTSTYFAYGEYLIAAGRSAQAEDVYRKALTIDPLSAEIMLMLPFAMYMNHEYEAALAADQKFVQVHPDFWALYMGLGYDYLSLGRLPESIAAFEKGRALNPEATINLSGLALAYARSGNRAEARKLLGQMLAAREPRYVAPFDIALTYDALGDREQAFEWLEKAYQDQSEMMLFLKRYPPWMDLESDPRFQKLVERVGSH